MGTYNIEELITLWEREKVTPEQAIGQILLILRWMNERIHELERRRWKQERTEGPTN